MAQGKEQCEWTRHKVSQHADPGNSLVSHVSVLRGLMIMIYQIGTLNSFHPWSSSPPNAEVAEERQSTLPPSLRILYHQLAAKKGREVIKSTSLL